MASSTPHVAVISTDVVLEAVSSSVELAAERAACRREVRGVLVLEMLLETCLAQRLRADGTAGVAVDR